MCTKLVNKKVAKNGGSFEGEEGTQHKSQVSRTGEWIPEEKLDAALLREKLPSSQFETFLLPSFF